MGTGRCYVGIQGSTLKIKMNDSQPVIETDAAENGLAPIDRFLQSAATVFKRELTVVLLSGANTGGQTGLRTVNENNGRVILRERSSSMVAAPLEAVAQNGLADAEVRPADLIQTVLNGFDSKP